MGGGGGGGSAPPTFNFNKQNKKKEAKGGGVSNGYFLCDFLFVPLNFFLMRRGGFWRPPQEKIE